MAKLQRVHQKIFGVDAIQAQFTQFGTAKNENPVTTKDIAQIQDSTAYNNAWADAVQEDYAPYMEDMNAYMYMVTTQLAYIFQQGAAIEWSSEATYYTGSIVSDGQGNWYKSITNDNTNNALTDTSNWEFIKLYKNGTPLFTQITTDYVLSGDDAIGWAMQGSNVSNSVYPAAYSKILALYNAGTAVTYRGITAKRSTDGRYIADVGQLSAINTLYSNTGVSDFYIIDTTGQSFYLPKTSRFIQYTTDTSLLNSYNDSGLPTLDQTISANCADSSSHDHGKGSLNIKGTIKSTDNREAIIYADTLTTTGAFEVGDTKTNFPAFSTSGTGTVRQGIYLNTDYNSGSGFTGRTANGGVHHHTITMTNTIGNQVYGRSTIVQPPSSLKLLYYRVGDTAV